MDSSMESRFLSLTKPESSVSDLYSIIKEEPNILEKIDDLPFINTPLHDASAAGKINIAMELMNLKPSFAKKLDADGFSPLHLAVQNNHVDLALHLVQFDPTLVRFPGREGMTPLHLVAKKGGFDLLAKFLFACPDSIKDANFNGETVLHITVINHKLEELKVLIGYLQKLRSGDALATEIHVLNSCDLHGNTALHLAASDDNYKVVKQLFNCMSLNRNIINKHGKTPLDVVRENGGQMKKKIEKLIQKSGGTTSNCIIGKVKPLSEKLRTPINFWVYCSTRMARYRSRMPENTRNALLVITALIITSTYQTAIQEEKLENQTIIEMLSTVTVPNTNRTKANMTEANMLMVNMSEASSPEASTNEADMIKVNAADVNSTDVVKSPEFEKKKRDVVSGMVVLWGFNTTAYLLSVLWTFLLLPAGREYICWYIAIIATLTTSFGLSTYRKYNTYGFQIITIKSFYINIYWIVVLAFVVCLIVVYTRWKCNKPKKVPELKTVHISKGCKSWCTLCC